MPTLYFYRLLSCN